eukprot:6449805-Alexandrium_andersonii.AAC.1
MSKLGKVFTASPWILHRPCTNFPARCSSAAPSAPNISTMLQRCCFNAVSMVAFLLVKRSMPQRGVQNLSMAWSIESRMSKDFVPPSRMQASIPFLSVGGEAGCTG